jgi:paraquat-inducible protein B
MSDSDPLAMEVRSDDGPFWRHLSPIWIVPILAIGVAILLAWRSYSDRGTELLIAFENASGVIAGETTVRYRDVVIGRVERVAFTSDLTQVIVATRINSAVARTIPPDATFWVARPEVSARGITGLSTVLSGVYIAGAWEPATDQDVASITGIETAPFVQPGQRGTQITIHAVTGNQLAAGAPILYRGIVAGRIQEPRLTPDGTVVTLNAFINEPFDQYLTSATRFWDMSGFAVKFGPGGLTLDVASIASLVTGGIAFDNVLDDGEPLQPGQTFDLFEDEETARNSVFNRIGDNAVTLAVQFEGTLSGLAVGAPVRYQGVDVGEVTAISASLDRTSSPPTVRLNTLIGIDPQALGLSGDAGQTDLLNFLESAVAGGLRARLASQNLFTAALQVELVQLPDAAPATLERPADLPPILPSSPSDIPNVAATAEGLLRRIDDLPVEELLAQAISLMQSVQAIADADGTRAAPEALTSLLTETRELIAAEDSQALPGEIRTAVASLREVVQELQQKQGVDRLLAAVDDASRAAEGIAVAAEDLPALAAELRELAQKANALDAETLVASATSLLENADRFIGSEDIQKVPPALAAALDDLRAVIAEVRTEGTVARLGAALDAAGQAAQGITSASAGVPALVEDLRALSAKAQALDAETLIASATKVLDSADQLIGTDAARSVPPALAAALEDLRAVTSEVRSGGTVARLGEALDAAATAAQGVSDASAEVPALVADLRELSAKAQALDAETLVASATKLLDSADLVIGTDAARQLPPALTAALEELRAVTSEVRTAGTVARLGEALEAAGLAAQGVAEASADVPALVTDLRALSAKAQALDAETLVASATKLLDSADLLIGTDAARQVPPALADALNQVRAALAELRAGGVIENANATFASTRRAADSVAAATDDLPALVQRLDRVAARADALVATYGAQSQFNQETVEMLREIRQAARSVAQLARAIERNPNSLLLGR